MHAPISRSAGSCFVALALALLAPAAFSATPHPLLSSPTALRVRLDRPSARPPVPGEVLVVENAGAIGIDRAGALAAQDPRLASSLSALGLDRGEELWSTGDLRFVRLHSSRADFDPAQAASELRATGLVRDAVPNLCMRLFDTLPNDPALGLQWYVFDGGGPADVRLPGAWDTERGGPNVRIGIMDTGVDLTHPDLAAQIWTNPGEIPGNGVDDDGDGYVDDVHGWDFGNGDNDPNPHPVIDPSLGLDIGFHGTFVAGIAAAATDNNEGIAGAGWHCSVVPLKVVDTAGDITLGAVTLAFGYAAQKHLEVLNMSFGTPPDTGVAAYFQGLVDQANAAGVLCVASAGNDGTGALNYPAACSGVLSVAATNESNARSDFSNYGPWVRVAAPGEGMWSTICQNYVVDDLSQIYYIYLYGWDGVTPYMYGDGTSFSAPLASGVAALVRSHHPDWTPLQVLEQLIGTGDVIAYDQPIGPKINAARAVSSPLTAADTPVESVRLAASPNPFAISATLHYALAAPASVHVRVLDCAGRRVRDLDSGAMAAGPHVLTWDGADQQGAAVRPGLYFVELDRGTTRERVRVVRLR